LLSDWQASVIHRETCYRSISRSYYEWLVVTDLLINENRFSVSKNLVRDSMNYLWTFTPLVTAIPTTYTVPTTAIPMSSFVDDEHSSEYSFIFALKISKRLNYKNFSVNKLNRTSMLIILMIFFFYCWFCRVLSLRLIMLLDCRILWIVNGVKRIWCCYPGFYLRYPVKFLHAWLYALMLTSYRQNYLRTFTSRCVPKIDNFTLNCILLCWKIVRYKECEFLVSLSISTMFLLNLRLLLPTYQVSSNSLITYLPRSTNIMIIFRCKQMSSCVVLLIDPWEMRWCNTFIRAAHKYYHHCALK